MLPLLLKSSVFASWSMSCCGLFTLRSWGMVMRPEALWLSLLVVPLIVGWVADFALHAGAWFETFLADRRHK